MLRIAIVFISTLLLTSCIATIHTVNCVDEKIEREPKPHDRGYRFVISIDHEEHEKVMFCVQYYDTHCSVRGNYWAWREQGSENDHRSEKSYIEGRLVKVYFPSCKTLVETDGNLGISDFSFYDQDKYLHLLSNDHSKYEFGTGQYSATPDARYDVEFTWQVQAFEVNSQ